MKRTVAAVIVTAAMSLTVRLTLRVTDATAEKQRATEVTAEKQRVTEVTVNPRHLFHFLPPTTLFLPWNMLLLTDHHLFSCNRCETDQRGIVAITDAGRTLQKHLLVILDMTGGVFNHLFFPS